MKLNLAHAFSFISVLNLTYLVLIYMYQSLQLTFSACFVNFKITIYTRCFQYILCGGWGGDLPARHCLQHSPGLWGQNRGQCGHPWTLPTKCQGQPQKSGQLKCFYLECQAILMNLIRKKQSWTILISLMIFKKKINIPDTVCMCDFDLIIFLCFRTLILEASESTRH